MSSQTIHDHLVATLGYKALAYTTVTKYLCTPRFDPAKDLLHSNASSPHLTSTIPIRLSGQPLRKYRFRQRGSLHEPPILQAWPFTGDSPAHLWLHYVIFAECHTCCPALRKCDLLNCLRLCIGCLKYGNKEPGTTL
jgi:hypothetical protein